MEQVEVVTWIQLGIIFLVFFPSYQSRFFGTKVCLFCVTFQWVKKSSELKQEKNKGWEIESAHSLWFCFEIEKKYVLSEV